jgi:hypothetical protein
VDEGEGEANESLAMANQLPNQRRNRQMGGRNFRQNENHDYFEYIDSIDVNLEESFSPSLQHPL